MKKSEAIELLGGTVSAAADAVGITRSAVSQWPDELPDTIRDRVQAAIWRKTQLGEEAKRKRKSEVA